MTQRAPLFWRKLDVPLKVTVLVASLGGVVGIIAALWSLSLPIDYSSPPIYPPLIVGSLISIGGALGILFAPMSSERRDVLGFVTFIISVAMLLAELIVLA